MGTRKIKRRRRVFRVVCDALAYIDEDGNEFFPRVGQWVEFKCKTSANDYARMLEFGSLETSNDLEELADAIPQMVDLVARKLTAWNWTDLDAEPDSDGNFPPLPAIQREILNDDSPSFKKTREVMAELDLETDLLYLIEMMMESTEAPKNESGPS